MPHNKPDNSGRGSASMDDDKHRDMTKKGGGAGSGNLKNNPEKTAEVGRKGSEHSRGGNNR